MNQLKAFSHLFIILLFISSCTFRMGDLTMISTRNIDKNTDYKEVGRKVIGKDKVVSSILGIPLGKAPSFEDATDNATGQIPGGEYVKNAVIREKYRWFILWSTRTMIVEGDVWGTDSPFHEGDKIQVKYKGAIIDAKILKLTGGIAQCSFTKNGKPRVENFAITELIKSK